MIIERLLPDKLFLLLIHYVFQVSVQAHDPLLHHDSPLPGGCGVHHLL